MPLIIKNILDDRKKKLKDWDIHVLDNTNINNYINNNQYPSNFSKLGASHKSDWIRLFLLKKYGGLWLDAGIIINSSKALDKIYLDSINEKRELTCFYLDGLTIENDPTTFIESWFILAPKNSRIIKAWYNEFTMAINMGFYNYKINLKRRGVKIDQIYYWGPEDTYLTIHAALQKVIQLHMVDNPNIKLYKAEDSMFKIQSMCNWNQNCIVDRLKNDKSIIDIPFIKLRGIDRQYN